MTDLDPRDVLLSAASQPFSSVIIVGAMESDGSPYLASSSGDGQAIMAALLDAVGRLAGMMERAGVPIEGE